MIDRSAVLAAHIFLEHDECEDESQILIDLCFAHEIQQSSVLVLSILLLQVVQVPTLPQLHNKQGVSRQAAVIVNSSYLLLHRVVGWKELLSEFLIETEIELLWEMFVRDSQAVLPLTSSPSCPVEMAAMDSSSSTVIFLG